jgi:hypothetical protein
LRWRRDSNFFTVAKKGSAVAKKGSTAANRLLARDYYHTYYNLTNSPVDCSLLRSFPVPGTHGLDQTGSWWSSSIADWIGPCQSVRSGLQSWTDRTEHCTKPPRKHNSLHPTTTGHSITAARAPKSRNIRSAVWPSELDITTGRQ